MSNHHGAPLIKREISLRRKPGPAPAPPSRDDVFVKLYAAALQGVASQFEVPGLSGHKPFHSEGVSELERAQKLATRAWNLTCYAQSMFDQSARVSEFEQEVE